MMLRTIALNVRENATTDRRVATGILRRFQSGIFLLCLDTLLTSPRLDQLTVHRDVIVAQQAFPLAPD
jgi:hypothetical protein